MRHVRLVSDLNQDVLRTVCTEDLLGYFRQQRQRQGAFWVAWARSEASTAVEGARTGVHQRSGSDSLGIPAVDRVSRQAVFIVNRDGMWEALAAVLLLQRDRLDVVMPLQDLSSPCTLGLLGFIQRQLRTPSLGR